MVNKHLNQVIHHRSRRKKNPEIAERTRRKDERGNGHQLYHNSQFMNGFMQIVWYRIIVIWNKMMQIINVRMRKRSINVTNRSGSYVPFPKVNVVSSLRHEAGPLLEIIAQVNYVIFNQICQVGIHNNIDIVTKTLPYSIAFFKMKCFTFLTVSLGRVRTFLTVRQLCDCFGLKANSKKFKWRIVMGYDKEYWMDSKETMDSKERMDSRRMDSRWGMDLKRMDRDKPTTAIIVRSCNMMIQKEERKKNSTLSCLFHITPQQRRAKMRTIRLTTIVVVILPTLHNRDQCSLMAFCLLKQKDTMSRDRHLHHKFAGRMPKPHDISLLVIEEGINKLFDYKRQGRTRKKTENRKLIVKDVLLQKILLFIYLHHPIVSFRHGKSICFLPKVLRMVTSFAVFFQKTFHPSVKMIQCQQSIWRTFMVEVMSTYPCLFLHLPHLLLVEIFFSHLCLCMCLQQMVEKENERKFRDANRMDPKLFFNSLLEGVQIFLALTRFFKSF
eukprot:g456.t1